ncbi:helix-turn-helix domain-containing protein [Companilactobacillus sp. DQM5]|uniref:helix-turn-helix domain-containing protein n=1 Tax=Companilactobacillus sp. DQM5 TaxID=3463359 RepID=UPI0040589FF6
MANNNLIRRLINLREDHNYSQSEVAKRLHLENSIISKIESGKRDVKSDELSQFSDLYNVSTDYLLGKSQFKNEDDFNRGTSAAHMDDNLNDDQKKEIANFIEFVKNRDKKD